MKTNIYIKAFLLVAAFISGSSSFFALPASYYVAHSQLSEGRWVKVRVDETGIFRIDYETLRSYGFDNPERVEVYGYGSLSEASHTFSTDDGQDLMPTATLHRDNSLYFYGESDVRAVATAVNKASFSRNYYDTHSYYFLKEAAQPLADMPLNNYSENTESEAVDFGYKVDLIEREVQNVGSGGVVFHGPKLKSGETEDFEFQVEGYKSNIEEVIYAGVDYAGFREAGMSEVIPDIQLSGNIEVITQSLGRLSTNLSSSYYNRASANITFRSADSDFPVKLSLTVPSSYTGNYFAVDKVYLIYPCALRVPSRNDLGLDFFQPQQNQNFVITDADASTEVWNVSTPGQFSRYELMQTEDGMKGTFERNTSASATLRMVVFDPAAVNRSPVFEEVVGNQDLHAMATPDFLIITTESLKDEAEELAAIHRANGNLDVAVVGQNQIFNEFSSGSRMPQGYRRFVKMLYDRNPSKLRYVLLYGPSSFDNRSINVVESDRLVCYQTESLDDCRSHSTNYVSDNYIGMLADDYDHSRIWAMPTQVSVGRIPVSDNSSARTVNAKIEKYLNSPLPAQARTHALFASDNGDENLHFDHSHESSDVYNDNAIVAVMSYADNTIYPFVSGVAAEAKRKLQRSLLRGQTYFSYVGHGDEASLASNDKLWDRSDVSATDYTVFPFAILSTCDTYGFDSRSTGIATSMVTKADGGMIALIAAGRSVLLDKNRPFNQAVTKAYASARRGDTFGDVYRIARNTLIESGSMNSSLGINTMCYNFCGDPAIPVQTIDYNIQIQSINDIPFDNTLANTFPALSTVKIKARITDASGSAVALSGKGVVEIYDAPITLDAANPDGEARQITVTGDLLAEFPLEAVDGMIEADVVIPVSARDGLGRIVLSVLSDDGYAAAGDGNFNASAEIAEDADLSAPVIAAMYIDDENFMSGDVTGVNSVCYAVIELPSTGVAMMSDYPGISPRVMLDGTKTLGDRITTDYDAEGHLVLAVSLTGLSDGRHSIDISIASLGGERASRSIDFIVSSVNASPLLAVGENQPFRSSVEFTLEHSYGDAADLRLVITDVRGHTVFSESGVSFPYTWDLTGTDNELVPDGRYSARVMLRSGNRYAGSEPVTFVVLKD